MLNEKGIVPKVKGWGMSNLGLWGKNPCVATFLVSPTSSMTWFCCWGQLWLVVEVVIAFGSGVAGLSVPYPHSHSTHDFLHSTLGLHLLHDAILPWPVHSHAKVSSVLLTHQLGALFVVHGLLFPYFAGCVLYPHAQEFCVSFPHAWRG